MSSFTSPNRFSPYYSLRQGNGAERNRTEKNRPERIGWVGKAMEGKGGEGKGREGKGREGILFSFLLALKILKSNEACFRGARMAVGVTVSTPQNEVY